ncbi:MAG: iron-sulfur cluster assembly scaffold protein [Eubacteriales bacterium]|nr:iron-sulfur cluster assembly scaffold protein [Eubacteriales bacterium]MDD3199551.1 iron-sulfur cluster assembly scaffold protein [Eubacteriales bacterium]MDD4122233.1 iron-sulfur cluster assembly scaffold protein [Eubacteriales bacterium]MDD4629842.1 iron-sulfur cluster assembly scaffold protein [Eubacteriales bacterium]
MYNDKVMDHFMNPHNAGAMENPDAVGTYGSPVCGDMMEIQLKIENNIIVDAKFRTFGCGSAIASSSVATDMIKGKTLEEALNLTNKNFIDELGGLPGPKIHCSVLAEQAVKSAIYEYAQKNGLILDGLKGFNPDLEIDEHHEEE